MKDQDLIAKPTMKLHIDRVYEHGDGYMVVEVRNLTTGRSHRFAGGYAALLHVLVVLLQPGDTVQFQGSTYRSTWGRQVVWTPEALDALIKERWSGILAFEGDTLRYLPIAEVKP